MGGGSNSSTTAAAAPETDYTELGTALSKGLSKGLEQYRVGATDTHNYMTGAGGYSQAGIPGSEPQQQYVGTQTGSMIPQSGGGVDVMAALQRLLGGLS